MKPNAKKIIRKSNAAECDPTFAPVARAFTNSADVSCGMMMSSYGLKVNGKIFAMFGRGKFVAKLPKGRVNQLVEQGLGQRFDPGHGRLMKEWIALADQKQIWVELAKEAYEFVRQGAA